ncbi:hypothetical protein ACE193_22795 [Bernardetia sp. OM2101]|uniref:hypothetical protein n=1 Tax=Bernardetia sp. OM2101 TaxID=3344876 RepID=UPI0035D05755
MSEIESKSEQNLRMARLSIEKACYATSIHCSYYACVQFMTHLLYDYYEKSDEEISIQQKQISKELAGGFHVWIINFFVIKLLPFEGGKIARDFSSDATQLKKWRVFADYKAKKITSDQAKQAQTYSENILKILQNYIKNKSS